MTTYFLIDEFAYTRQFTHSIEEAKELKKKLEDNPLLRGYDQDDIDNGWVKPAHILIEKVEAPDDYDVTFFHYMFAMNGWADNVCVKCGYAYNDDVHVIANFDKCPKCGRKVKRVGYLHYGEDTMGIAEKEVEE